MPHKNINVTLYIRTRVGNTRATQSHFQWHMREQILYYNSDILYVTTLLNITLVWFHYYKLIKINKVSDKTD